MKSIAPALPLRRAVLVGGVALIMTTTVAPLAARSEPVEHVVTMTNMSYGQIPGGLKVGDTIVWVNHDTVLHTITARDRSFDLRVNPGKSVRLTLEKAGTINFYCVLHSTMRGTMVVAAK